MRNNILKKTMTLLLAAAIAVTSANVPAKSVDAETYDYQYETVYVESYGGERTTDKYCITPDGFQYAYGQKYVCYTMLGEDTNLYEAGKNREAGQPKFEYVTSPIEGYIMTITDFEYLKKYEIVNSVGGGLYRFYDESGNQVYERLRPDGEAIVYDNIKDEIEKYNVASIRLFYDAYDVRGDAKLTRKIKTAGESDTLTAPANYEILYPTGITWKKNKVTKNAGRCGDAWVRDDGKTGGKTYDLNKLFGAELVSKYGNEIDKDVNKIYWVIKDMSTKYKYRGKTCNTTRCIGNTMYACNYTNKRNKLYFSDSRIYVLPKYNSRWKNIWKYCRNELATTTITLEAYIMTGPDKGFVKCGDKFELVIKSKPLSGF